MPELKNQSASNKGVMFLLSAYLLWGFAPVFWKMLGHVSSFELVLHRAIWSFLFLILVIFSQRRTGEIKAVFRQKKILFSLFGTMLLLSSNWFVFVWAVNNDQILQTSLGYYINPLFFVFLGMIFLNEHLRKLQVFALIIACTGVLYFSIFIGTFPWIAFILAISFGIYGLVHKRIDVGALPGLCVETMLFSVRAFIYLLWLNIRGNGAFLNVNLTTDFLLVGTCVFTAFPLLLFTAGARRTTFSTVGFMQYISPSCSFFLAIFIYNEVLSFEKLITFIMIWVALLLYTIDSVKYHNSNH
ncbi:MAG: EamA family transporter RarD [Desulfobacteraceae bacterium]|nr:EamA family transporter RarD [Desulfobacteraceae bacterium]